MNGVLNVSIPDGWVPEGIIHGKNGWLFGKGDQESAARDRDELFHLLEHKILPLYFGNRKKAGRDFKQRVLKNQMVALPPTIKQIGLKPETFYIML